MFSLKTLKRVNKWGYKIFNVLLFLRDKFKDTLRHYDIFLETFYEIKKWLIF